MTERKSIAAEKGEREMNKLKVVFPDLPYAVEEAMNRLEEFVSHI